jgi:hypothetical protein
VTPAEARDYRNVFLGTLIRDTIKLVVFIYVVSTVYIWLYTESEHPLDAAVSNAKRAHTHTHTTTPAEPSSSTFEINYEEMEKP